MEAVGLSRGRAVSGCGAEELRTAGEAKKVRETWVLGLRMHGGAGPGTWWLPLTMHAAGR